ncbi:hypothetical protein Gohar_017256, partial [Gossypium harknessii]|nr:hypothetical protein [Gossypium harknessii]
MKLWRLPRRFLKLPTSLGPSWNVATNVTPPTMILNLKLFNNLPESPTYLNNCAPEVTDEMVPINVEEWSGIDDEKY